MAENASMVDNESATKSEQGSNDYNFVFITCRAYCPSAQIQCTIALYLRLARYPYMR